MGRTGNNQNFLFPKDVGDRYRRYYYHSSDPLAPFDPTVPQIQFSMGTGDSSIQRDARYAMLTVSNFSPEFIVADIGIIGIDFHMPGASAYVGALSNGTDVSRLFVAYPAANAILEFSPTLLAPNGANSRYVVAYR